MIKRYVKVFRAFRCRSANRLCASAGAAAFLLSATALAQQPDFARPAGSRSAPPEALSSGSSAWFGLVMPGPATEQVIDFSKVGLMMTRPPDLGDAAELSGAKAHRYLEDVVGFAEETRLAGVRNWGRIASSPATEKTVDYVAGEFRKAGLTEIVKSPAPYTGPEPQALDWKVALIGAPEFGAGTGDVVLQSAFPMDARPEGAPGAPLPPGSPPISTQSVTAPLIYIGDGTPAQLATADVRGKVVVMRTEPTPSVFFAPAFRGAQKLVDAGAAGVLVVYDAPGNMQTHFGTCAGAPCFALGGEDGDFLNTVIARAAKAGVLDKLRVSLSETVAVKPQEHGYLLVGMVKGRSSAENMILSAHSDSWFAGANDNASGVAGLIALAKHYAAGPKPRHDMYFVVSPGHHSPTGSLATFVKLYPKAAPSNILMINLEHIAQQGMVRSNFNTGGSPRGNISKYGTAVAAWEPATGDSLQREVMGAPLTPTVRALIQDAAQRAGFVAPSQMVQASPAELSQIVAAGATGIQDVETSIWYHTSGDTPQTVAPESLQRALLFYKDIIDHADRLSRAEIRAAGP